MLVYYSIIVLYSTVTLVYYHFSRAVGNILDNLHNVAIDMGDELDRQNKQIGRINKKAEANVGHLSNANDRIKRQL